MNMAAILRNNPVELFPQILMPRPPLDYVADLRRRIKQADERIAAQIAIRAKLAGSYRLQSSDLTAYGTAPWQKDPVALDVSGVLMPRPSEE